MDLRVGPSLDDVHKAGPPLEAIRRMLLRAARARTTVTYGQLMKSFRLSRGRQLSQVIGEVDRVEYDKGSPGFAAIIVRKDTGFPGGGYFCDDRLHFELMRSKDRSTDPSLSVREKRHVLKQQRRIWKYYSQNHRALESNPPA